MFHLVLIAKILKIEIVFVIYEFILLLYLKVILKYFLHGANFISNDLVSMNGPFRWYNDTAKVKKLGNSKGILAFKYQGERVHTICPSAFPQKILERPGKVMDKVRFPKICGW